MYTAHKGFEKIVRKLIEKGVNVNVVNEDNISAIAFAASEGSLTPFNKIKTEISCQFYSVKDREKY